MAVSETKELEDAIARLKNGDKDAFRRLYYLTSPRLYGKLLALLKTPQLAREALLATYNRIWVDRETIPGKAADQFHFISTIAHRCALAIRFKNTNTVSIFGTMATQPMDEGGSNVSHSLHSMDETDRQMLTAAYLQFESVEAIAERMGLSPEAVRGRLAALAGRGGGGQ
jgi:DNA-directed RNA polymerase specialized sigma24 family protein